ncbi:TolC family protein [Vibrio sp. 99-70-13A1]|uniref:TolC family protein n=1 Tax=Vibrio sp. 99-70-13A1 TaxID=2607601 RepID=UPI0014938E72|nr:TolC family protein [Vibrio sp. 99-70-13A1]NOH98956.1 TolC family protein [Vibrio sp. 99-70-13A1]
MTHQTKKTFTSNSLFVGLISSALSFSCLANPISFADAWEMLQENNNSLAAQQANVERYQHLQNATGSLNLPSVTLGANYTHLDSDVTINGEQFADSLSGVPALPGIGGIISSLGGVTSTITEQDIFSSSIRAIWPIFTGGRITAAQDAAQGKSEEAKSQLLMETQARYEDLSKYYFSVLLAQDVLLTRKAVTSGLTQHRDFALKLEEQGQIAKVERLQAEASLDKAKVEQNKAKNDLNIAQIALTQILGQSETIKPSEQLFINTNLPDMNAFIEQTLSTYPGLQLLEAKEKQADSLIRAEKGKYYPEVYLYGDYSLHEDDSLASEMKPDWLVGIGVSVPLIDTSGRSDKVAAAHSAVSQVQYLKAQAKQDLKVLVQKTYLEAQQSIEEVLGLNSSLSLAQENLSLRKKAFNQGLANSLEVVDAELYLASIKTQQSVARFQYLISLNKLLALSSEMKTYSTYLHNAVLPISESRTESNVESTSQDHS